MVRTLRPLYERWSQNEHFLVILQATGNKAFCAGGDIVSIYNAKKSGGTETKDFFNEEYKLNYRIGTLPHPQVSILNGITMGGGVGLSVHGRYKVATENTVFAMPETAIGFFCDVGGSYVLPRLEHGLGEYLALTGARLKGRDVFRAGLATHFVLEKNLPSLLADLTSEGTHFVETVLARHSEPLLPSELSHDEIDNIRQSFLGQDTVEDIFEALTVLNSFWSKNTLDLLKSMSPTSLKVVHKQLQRGKALSFEECFKMEFRMSQHFMNQKDFFEGVRAFLVDKDKKPQWSPPSLQEVSPAAVEKYFAPLPHNDEWTPQ